MSFPYSSLAFFFFVQNLDHLITLKFCKHKKLNIRLWPIFRFWRKNWGEEVWWYLRPDWRWQKMGKDFMRKVPSFCNDQNLKMFCLYSLLTWGSLGLSSPSPSFSSLQLFPHCHRQSHDAPHWNKHSLDFWMCLRFINFFLKIFYSKPQN